MAADNNDIVDFWNAANAIIANPTRPEGWAQLLQFCQRNERVCEYLRWLQTQIIQAPPTHTVTLCGSGILLAASLYIFIQAGQFRAERVEVDENGRQVLAQIEEHATRAWREMDDEIQRTLPNLMTGQADHQALNQAAVRLNGLINRTLGEYQIYVNILNAMADRVRTERFEHNAMGAMYVVAGVGVIAVTGGGAFAWGVSLAGTPLLAASTAMGVVAGGLIVGAGIKEFLAGRACTEYLGRINGTIDRIANFRARTTDARVEIDRVIHDQIARRPIEQLIDDIDDPAELERVQDLLSQRLAQLPRH